jgi:hypothetical protein
LRLHREWRSPKDRVLNVGKDVTLETIMTDVCLKSRRDDGDGVNKEKPHLPDLTILMRSVIALGDV